VLLYQFKRKSSALCGTSEKEKSDVFFFFGSRHTQEDKLGVSLGGVLGATTTES
jgi:hypothetical protein